VALSSADLNNSNKILEYKVKASAPIDNNPCEAINPASYIDNHGETAKKKLTQSQKRLSDSEILNIIKDYQNGISTYALAEKYRCHRNTISRCLKNHGIDVIKEKFSSERSAGEVIRLYESGLKTAEIAEQFGVGNSTIVRCLHKNNVKMRTKWDY